MQVVLQPEDCYMVLCSDGIYEFMSNDEIVAIVHERVQQGAQPSEVAQHLVGPYKIDLYHITQCNSQTYATKACFTRHVQSTLHCDSC